MITLTEKIGGVTVRGKINPDSTKARWEQQTCKPQCLISEADDEDDDDDHHEDDHDHDNNNYEKFKVKEFIQLLRTIIRIII